MSWLKKVGNFFTQTIPSAAGTALGAVVDNVINPVFKPIFGSETGIATPALNTFVKDAGFDGTKSFMQNAASFAEKGPGALSNFAEKGITAVKSSPIGLIPGVSEVLGATEEGLEATKEISSAISNLKV